jgi:hypothetical protein
MEGKWWREDNSTTDPYDNVSRDLIQLIEQLKDGVRIARWDVVPTEMTRLWKLFHLRRLHSRLP